MEASLEPSWTVISERNPEGRPISAADRAHFGAVRLGIVPDWQLSWRRGSILSRLTGDTDSLPELLAEASRAARVSVEEYEGRLAPLIEAAQRAQELGKEFGVGPQEGYCPNLDVQAVTIREGGLSLHDGSVPLRRAGLGSRRLLSLALQRDASRQGGVTRIDEVEHGLEPYRVRQLVTNLGGHTHVDAGAPNEDAEQIIMATHSSIVVEHLNARNIRVVRNDSGHVTVTAVPGELQRVVRRSAEALLARKILVCEGKTEPGLVIALDRGWTDMGQTPFATSGVAIAPGGGRTDAPWHALRLSELGYEVAYFGDSDQPTNPPCEELEAAGVRTFTWAGESAIEDRLFRDLPWDAVLELLAVSQKPAQSIRDSAMNQDNALDLPESVDDWADSLAVREALAAASKRGKWFKRIELGEEAGNVVCEHWESIQESDLARVLTMVRDWARADV